MDQAGDEIRIFPRALARLGVSARDGNASYETVRGSHRVLHDSDCASVTIRSLSSNRQHFHPQRECCRYSHSFGKFGVQKTAKHFSDCGYDFIFGVSVSDPSPDRPDDCPASKDT